MAIPRVFVSSTCYDLKYIRENLKFFIRTIGYEPILSEDGDVYYNPGKHTHDSCVSEVAACQIFVLIIGGRYGGAYKNTDKSITNKEYEEAINLKIPIFTLVENAVYSEHNVYGKNNKKGSLVNAKEIEYPSVDNIKVFEFIDEVRKNAINNAICPFNDFSDIETYLKKQWAGMMHFYITSDTEAKRVNQLFESIELATEKIEYFTRQMANTMGSDQTKLEIDLYDLMLNYEAIRDIKTWNVKVSPKIILQNETIDKLCSNKIMIDEREKGISMTYGGPPYRLSKPAYTRLKRSYKELRQALIDKIREDGKSFENFIKSND